MRREQIVAAAARWAGTPYRHQAATRGAGCDCLGLVRGVWRDCGGREPVAVPPYGADWRAIGPEPALEAGAQRHLRKAEVGPKAGQVVLFRLMRNQPPRHCGIMLGPDRFCHAQEGLGVVIAPLSDAWRRRVAGCFEFPFLNG